MPTTKYLWDDRFDTVVMEKDGSGTTQAVYHSDPVPYGRLYSMRRNGKTYNYRYDGQGSTCALTDETGQITDTYKYDAWGNERAHTGTTINPYRFIGQQGYQYNEETQDYYVRERVYEPKDARWENQGTFVLVAFNWSPPHRSGQSQFEGAFGGFRPVFDFIEGLKKQKRPGAPALPPKPGCPKESSDAIPVGPFDLSIPICGESFKKKWHKKKPGILIKIPGVDRVFGPALKLDIEISLEASAKKVDRDRANCVNNWGTTTVTRSNRVHVSLKGATYTRTIRTKNNQLSETVEWEFFVSARQAVVQLTADSELTSYHWLPGCKQCYELKKTTDVDTWGEIDVVQVAAAVVFATAALRDMKAILKEVRKMLQKEAPWQPIPAPGF